MVLGLFAYVWQGIGTHLVYWGFGVFTAYPAFSWEGSFLRTSLASAGGVVASLAALLAQAYRNPVLGAFVVAASLAVLSLGVRRLLHSVQADKLRDLAWVPAILALAIYNQYDNPLSILLGMAVVVWMAVLYWSIPAKTRPVRLVPAHCEAIDQTGGDGQHVLHRAADLRADRVGRTVDA